MRLDVSVAKSVKSLKIAKQVYASRFMLSENNGENYEVLLEERDFPEAIVVEKGLTVVG